MQEFFKIFILSTIVITYWTAFILLQDKRGNRQLNRWYCAFLVALTTPQMDIYASLVVPNGIWQLSLVAATFLWLKGPFIWVFLKILLRQPINIKAVAPHFLPWLIGLIALCLQPQWWQPILLLGMAHMLTYLICAMGRLAKNRQALIQLWSGFPNSAYYWLIYVIAGLMVLVALDFVVMSLVTLGLMANYSLLDFYVFPGFSVYVLSIGVLSVYRPKFWFIAEASSAEISPTHATSIAEFTEPTLLEPQDTVNQGENKERYLALEPSVAQTLLQSLDTLMKQQLYRQSELSLPALANALEISVHQLSELLNVHLGKGFYDFLNGYRLEHARQLLSDPDCHLRVLDIAFEAGFNNKNSFYRAFKESFGVTPTQYRAQAALPGRVMA